MPLTQPSAKPKEAARTAAACFDEGCAHLAGERYADAFRQFTKAVQLDATAPEPYVGLAKVYEALDHAQRAEQAYRKAIEIDPKYHGARVALARLLCDFGKNEEALVLLTDADKTNPNDPVVWAEIAVNKTRLGNAEEAIPWLEKYNRAVGRQDWGYVHLGRAYALLGRTEAAETAYREGLAANPNNALANLWLGQLLLATGRKEEGQLRLLRNDGGNQGHWLTVVAATRRGGPIAIGARVTVKTGALVQIQDLVPVTGYLSQADPRAHFGLGTATRADLVEVRWPDGRTQQWRSVTANRFFQVVRDEQPEE